MKKITVFGTGCKKCVTTEERIKEKAQVLGIEINLSHVQDPLEIASHGIIRTPAVMLDNKLVHSGGLPKESDIEEWMK